MFKGRHTVIKSSLKIFLRVVQLGATYGAAPTSRHTLSFQNVAPSYNHTPERKEDPGTRALNE